MQMKVSAQLFIFTLSFLGIQSTQAQSINNQTSQTSSGQLLIDVVKNAETLILKDCRKLENLILPELQPTVDTQMAGSFDSLPETLRFTQEVEAKLAELSLAENYPGSPSSRYMINFIRRHCANAVSPKALLQVQSTKGRGK